MLAEQNNKKNSLQYTKCDFASDIADIICFSFASIFF